MKRLLQIDSQSWIAVAGADESGMGYQILNAEINGEPSAVVVVVDGSIVLPLSHAIYYSLEDIARGSPVPQNPQSCSLAITSTPLAPVSVSLPPGYVPTVGAVPSLGTYPLKSAESFFRYVGNPYVGNPTDFRFTTTPPGTQIVPGTTGTLSANTYLASTRERALATSGFGAVGRFALPLPLPARQVFEYKLQPVVQLQVGTVAPAFGQAGGGTEVKTPVALSVEFVGRTQIDDF